MFEHADFVSWALAAVGFGYGVWVDSLARKRLDIAHAGLVSLKPSIQGPNRDEVIAAIDDLLEKLKSDLESKLGHYRIEILFAGCMSPLLAQSGHCLEDRAMSLLEVKQIITRIG
jgi:hypothetical protein